MTLSDARFNQHQGLRGHAYYTYGSHPFSTQSLLCVKIWQKALPYTLEFLEPYNTTLEHSNNLFLYSV